MDSDRYALIAASRIWFYMFLLIVLFAGDPDLHDAIVAAVKGACR